MHDWHCSRTRWAPLVQCLSRLGSVQIEEAADTQGGGLIAGGSEEAAAEAKDEAAAWSELILANRVVLHLEVINKKSMKVLGTRCMF